MSRRTRVAWMLLVLLHVMVLAAGVVAPYPPGEQHRAFPYAPPTRLHVIDERGDLHLRPFVYASVGEPGPDGVWRYRELPDREYPVRLLRRTTAASASAASWGVRLFAIDPPAHVFLMGTDAFGRDQFSRFVHGGRLSLLSGLFACAIALTLGTLVGVTAGYYGGWVDTAAMRITEVVLALPWLYVLLAARAALPLSLPPERAFVAVLTLVGLVAWPRPALLVRAAVMSTARREYVLAARGAGATDARILARHLLPQAWPLVRTQSMLLVPQLVLAEVALGFLGLGVGEPTPSWGGLLASLQRYSAVMSYWWLFLPAVALVPVFLLFFAVAGGRDRPVAGHAVGVAPAGA